MNIGFSGTRFGMSDVQKTAVKQVLADAIEWHKFSTRGFSAVVVHHGDCVGADDEFHHIARSLGVDKVVIHPPDKDEHRAFCEGDESRSPAPHLVRNANIVSEAHLVITAPPTDQEQIRGGTWSTTRLARSQSKLWRVVLPSGLLVRG